MAIRPTAIRAIDSLFKVSSLVAGLLLIAMMVHITADVVMKFAFNYPLQGTLEIVAAYYMVVAVFLPLGLVEWSRQSIAVDLFYMMLPRSLKILVIAFVLSGMTLVYGAMAWQTLGDAVKAYGRNDYLMGGAAVQIINWPGRFALPLGFATAALVTAWQLLGVVLGFDRESWLVSHEITEALAE
jgi:TRAP-type C4-dicarboxylate transport system permease small subunit